MRFSCSSNTCRSPVSGSRHGNLKFIHRIRTLWNGGARPILVPAVILPAAMDHTRPDGHRCDGFFRHEAGEWWGGVNALGLFGVESRKLETFDRSLNARKQH
eukprot:1189670-Prorocentrum_minimum.AAC.3